jgi:hypothetical protein
MARYKYYISCIKTISDKLNKEIKTLLMHLWYLAAEKRIIYSKTNWPIII